MVLPLQVSAPCDEVEIVTWGQTLKKFDQPYPKNERFICLNGDD